MPLPKKAPRPFVVPTPPKPGTPGWLDARRASVEQLVSNRAAAEQRWQSEGRFAPQTLPAGVQSAGGGGGGGAPGGNVAQVYSETLLGLFGASIVSYLPLWEASGSVADDIGPLGNNGAYSNVTLGQPGIGPTAGTSAGCNGTTSYINWYSAGLASAFNGAAGHLSIWTRPTAAAMWTDGLFNVLADFRVDANNSIEIYNSSTNNNLTFLYRAGATSKSVASTAYALTTLMNFQLSWDAAAGGTGEVKAYVNGAQIGTTQTALGTWAGTPISTATVLGATNITPTLGWYGDIAHALLLNRAATVAEAATIYSSANP